MRRKHISSLSREGREKERLKAGRMFARGVTQAEVARKTGVTPSAVSLWHTAWEQGGLESLKSKGQPGFRSQLTPEKRAAFKRAILKGPLVYGYNVNLWTLPRLAAVMKKVTGVRFSEVWTWHIVRELGFTPQKPQVKAAQRDEKAIKAWKETRLPGLKKMGGNAWIFSSLRG